MQRSSIIKTWVNLTETYLQRSGFNNFICDPLKKEAGVFLKTHRQSAKWELQQRADTLSCKGKSARFIVGGEDFQETLDWNNMVMYDGL